MRIKVQQPAYVNAFPYYNFSKQCTLYAFSCHKLSCYSQLLKPATSTTSFPVHSDERALCEIHQVHFITRDHLTLSENRSSSANLYIGWPVTSGIRGICSITTTHWQQSITSCRASLLWEWFITHYIVSFPFVNTVCVQENSDTV